MSASSTSQRTEAFAMAYEFGSMLFTSGHPDAELQAIADAATDYAQRHWQDWVSPAGPRDPGPPSADAEHPRCVHPSRLGQYFFLPLQQARRLLLLA